MQPSNGADQTKSQHQPWAPPPAMQYPISPMVMPHAMVPPPPPQFAPPHFFGFHHPMHPPPSPLQQMGTSADENKTIWVGDLQYWMDENYLHGCFGHTGEGDPRQMMLSC